MLKMKSKTFLLVMLAAFVVLFAGTNKVQAQGEEVPTSCTTDLDWTIEMLDEPQLIDSCTINNQQVTPCYEWAYQVQSENFNTKGLNHINFNIPVKSSDATLIGQSDGAYAATVAVYDPGVGDPTTSFGKGILQYYVVKFTPQSTDGIWSFYSNTGKTGTATGGLKINNNLAICELGVPDSPGYPIMAVATSQNITTADNKNFRIIEDPYTQCILKAYEILPDGTERMLTKAAVEETLKAVGEDWEENLIYFGVPGQGCPRSIVKADGPNTWYLISGRWMWK